MKLLHKSILVTLALFSCVSNARNYNFNPALLGEQGANVDMDLFNQGGQLPGIYYVHIILNGELVDSQEIEFISQKIADSTVLEPCLNAELLSRYGVLVDKYPDLVAGGNCVTLSAIPEATSRFQFNTASLLLSIPQASLQTKTVGIASEALWDDGISAFLMNYTANTSQTQYRNSGKNTANYLQLNPGLNLGSWRIRNQTNWNQTSHQSGEWQTVSTYAERGINSMKSRLILGDSSTSGTIFDSVPFRGGSLASDNNMIPYTQRAFSPVVRGVARTEARVEVKQNGYIIYNSVVAPGPFVLTDLSVQSLSGGELEVTVKEADGSSQFFTIPFQTPAIALKEGHLDYSLAVGHYRPARGGVSQDAFVQATAMYGLPWDVTIYAGMQGTEHFKAGSLGLGVSMGNWGAFSWDMISAQGEKKNQQTEKGNAWRAIYSKALESTNTTVNISHSQFSSPQYSTLSEVMDTWQAPYKQDIWQTASNHSGRKSQTTLQLNQSLGQWGYLNLNSNHHEYWEKNRHNDSVGLNYGVNIGDTTLSLNLTHAKQSTATGSSHTDNQASVWVSVPLRKWLGEPINSTFQLTSSPLTGDSYEIGINGRNFDRQLYWDMRQRYRSGSDTSESNNSLVRLKWSGSYGTIGGNYSYGSHIKQMGANISGGLVLHKNGLTLSQELGETSALVIAQGASDIPVGGWAGVKTDFRGYTTQSNLAPYQENVVSLDPRYFPSDAEILQTDKKVVPTKGAIIEAKFPTRIGKRALVVLQRSGGAIPFGSLVTVQGEEGRSGIVGENGEVYLTGLPLQGVLQVQWSKGQCSSTYQLNGEADLSGLFHLTAECN
ncbi:F1 capsule-anchoring protein [Providencia manganoxydans]|uniref:fimbria/pilus outer membrane usher protein n=1 Tax=Providencia manganoxydans TaxID=2923283 RepID=UPI003B9A54BA